MTFAGRIGIIAGAGPFPRLVAENNPGAYVIRLEPFWDDISLLKFPGMNTRMDKAGKILAALRNQGITDVVMVGRVKRPSLLALRPDREALRVIREIAVSLFAKGDDALLRSVRAAVERRGLKLHAVHDLVQDLLAPKGIMGRYAPDDAALRDIEKGLSAARAHGAMDRGQAIVMQHGRVLDVEDRHGTDALIKRCKMSRTDGPRPILVKTAKPGQDRAVDMPTVGPDTIENAAWAGFAGIAFEAGSTLLADKNRMVALADQYGLFMIGVQ